MAIDEVTIDSLHIKNASNWMTQRPFSEYVSMNTRHDIFRLTENTYVINQYYEKWPTDKGSFSCSYVIVDDVFLVISGPLKIRGISGRSGLRSNFNYYNFSHTFNEYDIYPTKLTNNKSSPIVECEWACESEYMRWKLSQ